MGDVAHKVAEAQGVQRAAADDFWEAEPAVQMPVQRHALVGAELAGPLILAEVEHGSEDVVAQLQCGQVEKEFAEGRVVLDDIGFGVARVISLFAVEAGAALVDIGVGAVDHALW